MRAVTINQNRQVTGVLRGFDQFMNVVLDTTVDEKAKQDIGMVVRTPEPDLPCAGAGRPACPPQGAAVARRW